MDDSGLAHICQTYDRFFAVVNVLNNMIDQMSEVKSVRLLKHILKCYLRISDNKTALDGLRRLIPKALTSGILNDIIREDESAEILYNELLQRISV